MIEAAAVIVRELTARSQTLAVAESLTGGLLAAEIVAVPGASAVFRGGLVVYATDLKATLAGVPADLLAERGPVDPDVAMWLARGARKRCAADWGLATTGVAGPDQQNGVPVGTVYLGLAGPGGSVGAAGLGRPTSPRGPGTPVAGAGGAQSAGVADPVGLLLARRLDLGRRPGRVLDRAGIRAASVEGALALLAEQL